MSMFLERVHGLGQQRVAARLAQVSVTQVAGNCDGLPISVAGMRPIKTGTYSYIAARDEKESKG